MKTIKDVLKIKVEKYGKVFQADAKILTGSPPVGIGKTKDEALYSLLARLMFQVGGCSSEQGHLAQWTDAIRNFWENERKKII